MISSRIPLENVPGTRTPAIYRKYITEPSSLSALFAESPSPEGIIRTAKSMNFPSLNRKVLCETLRKQYTGFKLSPLQSSNLEALSSAKTFTVCTGHQLCLLGGPLYFTLKILSAVRLCRELNGMESGMNFIPLFWMHTEDHDKEEIASVEFFGKSITWNTTQQGAVGSFSLADLPAFLKEVSELMGDTSHAGKLKEMIRDSYDPSLSLSDATRKFVHALFGRFGLLALDPSDPALKKLFVPVIKEELSSSVSFRLVNEEGKKIREMGFEMQVHPREINLFDLELRRERIIDPKAYLHLIDKEPERFSPNVVLRSVYQQLILPNAAYAGGPAEIAYWLQYRGLLQHFKLAFPVLVPRNSVIPIEKSLADKLAEAGLTPEQILESDEAASSNYLEKLKSGEDLQAEKTEMFALSDKIIAKAASADASLSGYAGGQVKKMMDLLDGIETKMRKSLKKRESEGIARILRIRQKLCPGGKPRERVEAFIPWYLQQGDAFFDNLIVQFEPIPRHALVMINKE